MSQVGKRLGDDHLITLQNDQDLYKNAKKKKIVSPKMRRDSKAIPPPSHKGKFLSCSRLFSTSLALRNPGSQNTSKTVIKCSEINPTRFSEFSP